MCIPMAVKSSTGLYGLFHWFYYYWRYSGSCHSISIFFKVNQTCPLYMYHRSDWDCFGSLGNGSSWPGLTPVYLQKIRGWHVFDPGIFWSIPMRFFLTQRQKSWKMWDFCGKFSRSRDWLTQLDLSNKKWPDPQKFSTLTHH